MSAEAQAVRASADDRDRKMSFRHALGIASIAGAAHVPVTLGSERFLWLNLAPLEFTMPSHDYIELAAYILVSAVAIDTRPSR